MVAAMGALPKYLTFQSVLAIPLDYGEGSWASTLNRFCLPRMKVCPKFILPVGNSQS